LRKDSPLDTAIGSFFVSNYDIAKKTKEFYQTSLTAYVNYLREQLGHEPIIADIDKDYVNSFLERLSKKPTTKYPNGSAFRARAAASTLKRFANWLAQEGILFDRQGNSVLRHVKKARVSRDVRQPLKGDELEQVLDGAGLPGERDHTLVVLLAGTGLRLNEIRELKVGDLNLPERQLTVRAETSKFRKSRTVDFHDAVARELDRHLRNRSSIHDDDPVLATDEGTLFSTHGLAKVFQRIRGRSGVRQFSAHILRHSWATNYMRQPGANLLELKRQGGWSSWEQVERYSHAVPVRDRRQLPNPLERRATLRPASVVTLRPTGTHG
jgi:site-specific recombinase XerD